MSNFVALFLTVVILAIPAWCHAGVVVDEQETISQPRGNNLTRVRTVMIEGNLQKSIIDGGKRIIITDLDKGTMTVLDGIRKTYVEVPFPPTTRRKGIAYKPTPSTIIFKKTGVRQNIIGYSCDVYSGTGTAGSNKVNETGCYSESVPGISDYSNFQHKMAEKVEGTPLANSSENPPGVPLTLTITTTFGSLAPGLPPERAAKIRELLARAKLTTSTTVSRITATNLPASSFQVPCGYHKQSSRPKLSGNRTGPSTKAPAMPKMDE